MGLKLLAVFFVVDQIELLTDLSRLSFDFLKTDRLCLLIIRLDFRHVRTC